MAKAYSSAITKILKNAGFREARVSKKGKLLSPGFKAMNASTPSHLQRSRSDYGPEVILGKRQGNAVYVEWQESIPGKLRIGGRNRKVYQSLPIAHLRENLEELQDVLRDAGYKVKFGRNLIDQLELVVHAR